ncbi:MAG: urease accessory protein UreF, partial [Gammaproteobacteria bacterium]|nr:urease accessory protein UreF [Gammaproteobacteria bacterium]
DAAQTGDIDRLAYWNRYVLACRETRELYDEDTHLGRALYRLLAQAGEPGRLDPTGPISLLCAFAEAAVQAQVPSHACIMGWLWTWLENQIAVACKTLPLGQSAAQQILRALLPALVDVANTAHGLPDTALGASFPGFAIISAKHETQYSRLFRS